MRNWIEVVKRVRAIIKEYPDSSLCQAKFITDFIRENFKYKKGKHLTPPKKEEEWITF